MDADMNPKQDRIKRLEDEVSKLNQNLGDAESELRTALIKRDMLSDKLNGLQLVIKELQKPEVHPQPILRQEK